jgi:hypothetical protein
MCCCHQGNGSSGWAPDDVDRPRIRRVHGQSIVAQLCAGACDCARDGRFSVMSLGGVNTECMLAAPATRVSVLTDRTEQEGVGVEAVVLSVRQSFFRTFG